MRSYVGRGVGAYFLDKMFLAKRYVYVASRWISPEYAEKLIELARRGVLVRVITSDAREKSHQEALEAMKKALEPPTFARIRGWKPPSLELGIIRERFLHVKLYVFDDEVAVVGSANLTKSGMWHNIEHVIVFDQPDEVQQLKHDFEKLWQLYTEDKKIAKEIKGVAHAVKKLGRAVGGLIKRIKKKK